MAPSVSGLQMDSPNRTSSYAWAEEAQLAEAHSFLAVPCLPERLHRLLRWWLPNGHPPLVATPAKKLFSAPAEPGEPALAHPIESAVAHVEAHLNQRLSLDEVSRYVYLSASHFCFCRRSQ